MLSDDVTHILRGHEVKVENCHFGPSTKNQYLQIESKIHKSLNLKSLNVS